MIYFIQSDYAEGFIKIGLATNLERRLEKLQCATAQREQEIHERFRDLRVRGEWFRPDESLVSFIKETEAECLGGNPEPEAPDKTRLDLELRKARARKVRAEFRANVLIEQMERAG